MFCQMRQLMKKLMSSAYWVICIVMLLPIVVVTTAQVFDIHKTVRQERIAQPRQQIETVANLVMFYSKQELAGKLSQKEAQSQVLAAIKALRYDENNYFWVNDTQGVLLMHPFKPELENKSLLGVKDKNGTRVFTEIVRVASSTKEGYVSYYWPRPNGVEEIEKISYVRLFPQWGWIIGTGVYVEDINKKIEKLVFDNLILACLVFVITLLVVSSMLHKFEIQCARCYCAKQENKDVHKIERIID